MKPMVVSLERCVLYRVLLWSQIIDLIRRSLEDHHDWRSPLTRTLMKRLCSLVTPYHLMHTMDITGRLLDLPTTGYLTAARNHLLLIMAPVTSGRTTTLALGNNFNKSRT